MHRAIALTALLLAPLLLAPNASASSGVDEIQDCVGSGHWTTLVFRYADCTQQCIGSGHWTGLPERIIACATS